MEPDAEPGQRPWDLSPQFSSHSKYPLSLACALGASGALSLAILWRYSRGTPVARAISEMVRERLRIRSARLLCRIILRRCSVSCWESILLLREESGCAHAWPTREKIAFFI